MHLNIIKCCVVAGVVAFFVNSNYADAQRSGYGSSYGSNSSYGRSQRNSKKRATTTNNNEKKKASTSTQSAYGGNGGDNGGSEYGNNADYNRSAIDTSLPMEVIKGGSGLLQDAKPSLRNDAPYQTTFLEGASPLPYQNVREDDVPFKVRVWREIDTREKVNKRFNYDGVTDNGSQRFIDILLRAIRDDGVTAFSGDDDRFTTPITPEQAISAFGGGMDTSASYDLNSGQVNGYQVRAKAVDPDSIYRFRIKEDWFFDRNTSRMFVRIIGIAPIISYTLSTGQVVPNSEHAAFWVYYPDLRPELVKSVAYNPYNPGSKTTWEDVFESREFSSFIVKSDLNNPSNLPLKSYISDPMFRLYEGEKIKDKIFNYEQNLWSY